MKSSKKEAVRNPQPLGTYLANIRATKKMTLREVEEATDHEVSNAYISQLENGKITKPSPNILHKLASAYGIAYELLMQKAGYLKDISSMEIGSKHGRVATFANDNLTVEEEENLLEYLAFLRSRKKAK
jgi:transcriptional regulator with XRE-family HTH domain